MTPKLSLHDIPGAEALTEWFGRMPRFHDAKLLEVTFSGDGTGRLLMHAWNMTHEVDSEGYFVLDKHAMVTLAFEGVSTINCVDFDMVPGIVFDLEITKVEDNFRIEWSASYGVAGFVTAKNVRISLVPGKPD